MIANNASGIVFDSKSGIPEEEQREILAKIDSIAEKNRLSLSGSGQGKSARFKAKKTGGFFPIAVIITAISALAGGLLVLSSVQWKTDTQARTGSKVENSVERALIEEIRKETHNNAAVELERLNSEQYRSSAVEDQIGAFFANLNRQISNNSLDEAERTIRALREFINTPAFGSLRSIQARKGLYIQAVNSFETIIESAKKNPVSGNNSVQGTGQQSDFQARIALLEQELAEKNKTIEAFSSQGTSATRRLSELENNNKTLQQNLTQTTTQLQQAASDLQTEKQRTATLTQTVSSRDTTIQQRDNSIKDLQQRINKIQDIVQGKAATDMTIGELSQSVSRIQEVLIQ